MNIEKKNSSACHIVCPRDALKGIDLVCEPQKMCYIEQIEIVEWNSNAFYNKHERKTG